MSKTLAPGLPYRIRTLQGMGGPGLGLELCTLIYKFSICKIGNSDATESLRTFFLMVSPGGRAARTSAANLTAVTAVCVDTVNLISCLAAVQQGRDS